jgi:hypothetical protein
MQKGVLIKSIRESCNLLKHVFAHSCYMVQFWTNMLVLERGIFTRHLGKNRGLLRRQGKIAARPGRTGKQVLLFCQDVP